MRKSKKQKEAINKVYNLIKQRVNNVTIHYESCNDNFLEFYGYDDGTYIEYISILTQLKTHYVDFAINYLIHNHFISSTICKDNDYIIFYLTEVKDA